MSQDPKWFQIYLEALEDFHIGDGTGSGDIDASVVRDRLGRPYIPASHFKGLLREATEDLLRNGSIDHGMVERLLGQDTTTRLPDNKKTLQRGCLRLRSLRISGKSAVKTLTWASSARSAEGRHSSNDTLRFIEFVAAGQTFNCDGVLYDGELQAVFEQILRRIDRIGSGRNRGGGLVKLSWRWKAGAGTRAEEPADRRRLRLIFRNLEPLCLPATGHPGNLIESHSFIRGHALRGALMAWSIRRKEPVFDFSTCSIGDALPFPEDHAISETALPAPLSLRMEKPQGGDPNIPWWIQSQQRHVFDGINADGVSRQSNDGDSNGSADKPKRLGAHEYVVRTKGDNWLLYSAHLSDRLRNQTPKTGSGEEAILFGMEEIAENTLFQSDIVFEDGQSAQAFWTNFLPLLCREDWISLGRGGTPLHIESLKWLERTQDNDPGDNWTFTLTSDLIIRGPNLGFRSDLSIEDLCTAANVDQNPAWKLAPAFVETESVHGFNGVTGLHRSPAEAIRRGSCWTIKGNGSSKLAQGLQAREAIGERTSEGFGRFVIGIQPLSKIVFEQATSMPIGENREETLLHLAKLIADDHSGSLPSLSQLQFLRSRALASSSAEELDSLLEQIKQAPKTRPRGAAMWDKFPFDKLSDELGRIQKFEEKRKITAFLAEWFIIKAKSAQEQSA